MSTHSVTKPFATDLVKLYYRIGEVSQIVGVQPHVLRYWESEFRTIRPQKSNKGQRIYSRRDVEKLLRVKDLLKNQGFTIAGARKRLKDPHAADPDPSQPIRRSGLGRSPMPSSNEPSELVREDAAALFASDATPAAECLPLRNGKALRRALLSLRQDLRSLERQLRPAK